MHACAHRYILSPINADLICILNLFKLSLIMSHVYKMGWGGKGHVHSHVPLQLPTDLPTWILSWQHSSPPLGFVWRGLIFKQQHLQKLKTLVNLGFLINPRVHEGTQCSDLEGAHGLIRPLLSTKNLIRYEKHLTTHPRCLLFLQGKTPQFGEAASHKKAEDTSMLHSESSTAEGERCNICQGNQVVTMKDEKQKTQEGGREPQLHIRPEDLPLLSKLKAGDCRRCGSP